MLQLEWVACNQTPSQGRLGLLTWASLGRWKWVCITMSTLRNQGKYFKNCSLWFVGFFFFSLDYLFSVQIGSLKDEIMIMSLFLGLSLILHPLPVLAATHPLTPYRSSSLLESPFHLFVALKLVFSFLHWEKWERVAGLCSKWKDHRG